MPSSLPALALSSKGMRECCFCPRLLQVAEAISMMTTSSHAHKDTVYHQFKKIWVQRQPAPCVLLRRDTIIIMIINSFFSWVGGKLGMVHGKAPLFGQMCFRPPAWSTPVGDWVRDHCRPTAQSTSYQQIACGISGKDAASEVTRNRQLPFSGKPKGLQ